MSFPRHVSTSSPASLSLLLPHMCCPCLLPSCLAISSQRCCLKSSRKQSRDIPSTKSRAQDHLRAELWQAPCQSFHCRPPLGTAAMRGFPPEGRFLAFPTLSLIVHEGNYASAPLLSSWDMGHPPHSFCHRITQLGCKPPSTVQLHPKPLPAKTNKPCDF